MAPSCEDICNLVANMKGLMLGNSKVGLQFYWPVEMQYNERIRLNIEVESRMSKLNRKDNGCFYDRAIEDMYVVIFTI